MVVDRASGTIAAMSSSDMERPLAQYSDSFSISTRDTRYVAAQRFDQQFERAGIDRDLRARASACASVRASSIEKRASSTVSAIAE